MGPGADAPEAAKRALTFGLCIAEVRITANFWPLVSCPQRTCSQTVLVDRYVGVRFCDTARKSASHVTSSVLQLPNQQVLNAVACCIACATQMIRCGRPAKTVNSLQSSSLETKERIIVSIVISHSMHSTLQWAHAVFQLKLCRECSANSSEVGTRPTLCVGSNL